MSTASHGGYWISQERLLELQRIFPNQTSQWFEEDCDWCIVVVAFPFLAPEKGTRELAKRTMKDWHPDLYESFFDEKLLEGQSYKRDNDLFAERTRDRLVVISVEKKVKDRDGNEYVQAVASMGGERKAGTLLTLFWIPKERFQRKRRHSYVIQPEDLTVDPSKYDHGAIEVV